MKLQTCRIQCMLSVCIGPRNLYGRPQNHEKPPVELTNTPSQKAPTRHWLLGPRPMEFSHKSRESCVRAWSWPRAAATEAAPSLPQSVAVQLAGSFKRWGAMHFWTHFTHFQTTALSTHLEFSCLQQAQASLNTSPELLASNFRRPSRKKNCSMSRNREGQSRDGGLESGKNQGVTLFAEAGLRSLAFFLQVLQRQQQEEHKASHSGHVCA